METELRADLIESARERLVEMQTGGIPRLSSVSALATSRNL